MEGFLRFVSHVFILSGHQFQYLVFKDSTIQDSRTAKMLRQATFTAFLIGVCAILFSSLKTDNSPPPISQGKNNTILFITNEHPGLYNVHLSTLYSLLQKDSQFTIHYASFPKVEQRVKHISDLAANGKPKTKDVNFHPLPGFGYTDSLQMLIDHSDHAHAPGLASGDRFGKNLGVYIAPWSAVAYWTLFESCDRLITEIDPAVIIFDAFLTPGINAARQKNRLHAIITPNVLSDLLPAGQQPLWTLFWKYPALGSGFPYPVPWKLIPANMYINFRIMRAILYLPEITSKRKQLEKMGIQKPIDFMGLYRKDVPWITQTLPGAHTPVARIPENVTLAGPINLAGLEKKSPAALELLEWAKKPTVLISLGSGFKYHEWQARAMIEAIHKVLKQTEVQILWKMSRRGTYEDQFLKIAAKESKDRLRIEKWLEVEPPTLLQEGNILTFVHHGGAGSYHDSLG
jgi:hypothetical protein